MAIKWIGPIKDTNGGYLIYDLHDATVARVYNDGNYAFCGFKCQRQNFIPGSSDEYESHVHTSFFRFSITDWTTPTSCKLYLYYSHGEVVEANTVLDYPRVQVFGKYYWESEEFPWEKLDTGDYAASWTQWGSVSLAIKQLVTAGIGQWLEIDITSAYQHAVAQHWDHFAIRLKCSDDSPSDWDWNNSPETGPFDWWGTNEQCWVAFYGATAQQSGATLPGTYGTDESKSTITYCPIIKVTYDTTPPPVTASPVNAVAADAKAKLCLAGTVSGRLWRIKKTDAGWLSEKVWETGDGSQITAIYIDRISNFKDYPLSAIVWVGTSNGGLYRSFGLGPFYRMDNSVFGANPIIEIRGSDLNPAKIVLITTTSLWLTNNGGSTWSNPLSLAATGVYVRGDEIQVIYSSGMERSPDFGATWYGGSGVSSAVDIAFSKRDITKSVIVAAGNLLKYNSGNPNFAYVPGAGIVGVPRSIDADPDTELMLVGTSSNLYQTVDWGASVVALVPGANVTQVALGGTYLIT